MTDGKPQPCKNGCGQQVFTSDRDGKWKPYNVTNEMLHDCPNNPYKQQFKQVAEKVEQEITSSGQSAFKKNDTLGRIADLETQYYSDIKAMNIRIGRLEGAVQALVKELSFKKGTEVVTED